LLVAQVRPADACSCGDPPPVCEAFQSAAVVFVGKVTEIKAGEGGTQEVTFAVSQKLKGNPIDTEHVEGGGMCGTVFQMGKTYFVYAASSGRLSSSLCGRTTTLDRAKEDLAYARSTSTRKLGMIGGTVAVHDAEGNIVRRAGAQVRIVGEKRAVKTDKNGRFTLELPPGKYTLDVVDAKARLPVDYSETVSLPDAMSCAKRDLVLVWNGRVRGRVLTPQGKPAAQVQLTLVAAGTHRTGNQFATTDAKGQYEFSGIQAGEYTVVAYSAMNVPTTTFYPNVDDPSKAKVVTMLQSGVAQHIDIKLLP
jgi:hypothetical protein